MAAEIKTKPQQRQPVLLSRIEDDTLDVVTSVDFTTNEDGIITVGEDKYWNLCISLKKRVV